MSFPRTVSGAEVPFQKVRCIVFFNDNAVNWLVQALQEFGVKVLNDGVSIIDIYLGTVGLTPRIP